MKSINSFELIVSSALFGIIWLVQLVHYPSFLGMNSAKFKQSMKFHQNRISLIVVPLMISEILISFWMAYRDFSFERSMILLIVALLWTSTITIQVPSHEKLLRFGRDQDEIRKLIRTNWIRTILWTLKLNIVLLQI